MPEHTFTLILTGPVDDHIDDLYDAGLDDAMIGATDGVSYAEFDREAPTLADAVRSAIRDVETVPHVRVTRVEPDDMVTAAEIAERLGRSRESVRLLIAGKRGAGDFPAPVSHLRQRTRLWRWSDVIAWDRGERQPEAELIAALNAALTVRSHAPLVDAPYRGMITDILAFGEEITFTPSSDERLRPTVLHRK